MANTSIDGFHNAEAVKKMKYRPLGDTGMSVSILSYGASALGSMYRKTDDDESCAVVKHAVSRGINYIDVAPWYGHTVAESVLGKALKGIPRDSYYIATKVGRYLPEADKMFDFSAERTLKSVEDSLGRLGLDYVDVIQVHDMEFAPNIDIIVNETLPALQKVKDAGKARFIGITGYPLALFREVIERSSVKIDTILSYCHLNMNDTSLHDMVPYFKEKGIGVINASPIGMSLLSNRGPPTWHPATTDIKDACVKAARYCQEKGVDISKLAMHFTLGFDDVPTTLVSTASLINMQNNMAAVYEELTALEKQTLDDVMTRFMRPLNNKTWDGSEVNEYWRDLRKLQDDKVHH